MVYQVSMVLYLIQHGLKILKTISYSYTCKNWVLITLYRCAFEFFYLCVTLNCQWNMLSPCYCHFPASGLHSMLYPSSSDRKNLTPRWVNSLYFLLCLFCKKKSVTYKNLMHNKLHVVRGLNVWTCNIKGPYTYRVSTRS